MRYRNKKYNRARKLRVVKTIREEEYYDDEINIKISYPFRKIEPNESFLQP